MAQRLPSVFISHGSPMHALEPGAAGEAWKALGIQKSYGYDLINAGVWERNKIGGSAKITVRSIKQLLNHGVPPLLRRPE